MDARIDITDLYAFRKSSNDDKSILILNVNPLAPTHADEFRHDARYELLIDNDGDARPNVMFSIRFSKKEDGKQFATVRRQNGSDGSEDEGDDDSGIVIEHAPVSFGSRPHVTTDDDYRFFAGLRSDPFFFDLVGFLHPGFPFTGDDFFKMLNVFGIVLEVPNRALGPHPKVGVWAHTLIPATLQPKRLVQVDQMGRPAINTVFNHGNDKVTFNGTQPIDQRGLFLASFVATLESFGYNSADATNIGDILLPDILTYDFSSSAGFLNGRKLTDDVIDIELNLVSKGAVTTDKVGPHSDYLSVFPYLGTPH